MPSRRLGPIVDDNWWQGMGTLNVANEAVGPHMSHAENSLRASIQPRSPLIRMPYEPGINHP